MCSALNVNGVESSSVPVNFDVINLTETSQKMMTIFSRIYLLRDMILTSHPLIPVKEELGSMLKVFLTQLNVLILINKMMTLNPFGLKLKTKKVKILYVDVFIDTLVLICQNS